MKKVSSVFLALGLVLLFAQSAFASGDNEGLLVASSAVMADAINLKEEVEKKSASYKRTLLPAERFAEAAHGFVQAVTEGSPCVRIKILRKGVMHKFKTLKTGYESDHAIWKVEAIGLAFGSLKTSYDTFAAVSGEYVTHQYCE